MSQRLLRAQRAGVAGRRGVFGWALLAWRGVREWCARQVQLVGVSFELSELSDHLNSLAFPFSWRDHAHLLSIRSRDTWPITLSYTTRGGRSSPFFCKLCTRGTNCALLPTRAGGAALYVSTLVSDKRRETGVTGE